MCCRGTLLPDPRYDALRCIVLAAADDAEDMSDGNYTARVLLFHEKTTKLREGLPNVQVHMHASCCLFGPCYLMFLPCCSVGRSLCNGAVCVHYQADYEADPLTSLNYCLAPAEA